MPKLWTETIATHRREVGDAILDTTVALVAERGLRAVTMSEIAEHVGIGRATLYKYFPDVEAILHAWHERHVAGHLFRLAQLREEAGEPGRALVAVLGAYAAIVHARARAVGGADVAALLHRPGPPSKEERELRRLFHEVLVAARGGHVRDDVAPDELVRYCLHALGAAADAPNRQAVERLVALTLAALAPRADARP